MGLDIFVELARQSVMLEGSDAPDRYLGEIYEKIRRHPLSSAEAKKEISWNPLGAVGYFRSWLRGYIGQ